MSHTLAAWLRSIATDPQAQQVAGVLRALAERGLREPAVASGFTRSLLMGAPPTDVDIHYVGAIPTATAEAWLAAILRERGLAGEWDIWNFQEHDPLITTTTYGYRAHFVSTIDCVYLGPDGALHDLTGRGAADAQARILEFTHLAVADYPYRAGQLCYLLLEGCRRIFQHGLTPTPASERALRASVHLWREAEPADRAYLRDRLRGKLNAAQRALARPIYARYGWDAIFDDEDVT